jgi:primosomal protein N' (replication factor Y)
VKLYKIVYLNGFSDCFEYTNNKDFEFCIGDVVKVELLKKETTGIIIEIRDFDKEQEELILEPESENKKKKINFKPILNLLTSKIFSLEDVQFLKYLTQYNIANISQVFQAALPAYIASSIEKGKLSVNKKDEDCCQTDVGLYKKYELNNEQLQVSNAIQEELNSFNVSLIYGRTGSGKTYIFADLIYNILKQEKKSQVLILLPEIGLTNGIAKKIQAILEGVKIAIWHSKVSNSKKKKIFSDIINQQIEVVIGTRSALLLPYSKLKMIIVDEEHDGSYKQGDNLLYNARDMAVVKGQYLKIPIVLSSATPSIESFVNVLNKKYKMHTLMQMFFANNNTNVITVPNNAKRGSILNDKIVLEIKKTLQNGYQAIIFINRRGFTRTMRCNDCQSEIKCINCENLLSYHKNKNYLKCHYCDYKTQNYECQICKSSNTEPYGGIGVEKLEQEILQLNLKDGLQTLIFSSDEIANNDDLELMTEKINKENIDIIIGTQIVSKGHHFPRVRLVIILDIDCLGNDGDFRAFERLFQLLTQLLGRAGREGGEAKAIIQTNNSGSQVIKPILCNDYNSFYQNEISQRRKSNLPPFSRMILTTISSSIEKEAQLWSEKICNQIRIIAQQYKITVFGPNKSYMPKMKKQFRYSIMLQFEKINTKEIIKAINQINQNNKNKKIVVKYDIDPYHFI